MTRVPQLKTRLAAAAAIALAACPALGADFDLAGGKLSVGGSIFMGVSVRTDTRDPELLPAPNAALVGATGTAVGGKNQDDGNLNFNKSGAVSHAAKGVLELAYRRDGYGAVAQLKGWYDFALIEGERPFGNLANGYAAGAPLSDEGFATRSKFSGLVADDVYVFGRTALGATTLDWKLGAQKLDWGNRFTIAGGLGDLSPRDLPASRRAGALPDEGRIPVTAVTAQLAITPSTTVDAFLQAGFEPNAVHGCGTFYSASDFVSNGCNKGLLGAASDRASIANGVFIKRASDETPDSAQGGIGVRHKLDAIGAEMGLYVAQFHARGRYLNAIKSQRTTGAPFLPNDPGGLNPQYFISFPENIRVLGLTFEKKLAAGVVLGELTYRPNQPYQYNTVDLLNAFATAAGPTPLRAAVTATPAGAAFNGYERHKALQLNLAAVHGLPPLLGAAGGNVAAELAFKHADLPDPSVIRFRRPDVYGQAPVGAAPCPPTASAKTCSTDGYVSANASAYRLRVGLRYPQLVAGVDFLPSLTFGHDVSGWSEDGAISEGRQFAVLSLKAEIRKAFVAELAWQPTWGGAYNNLKDRSAVSASLGYRF